MKDDVEICRMGNLRQHLSGCWFGKIRCIHRYVVQLFEFFCGEQNPEGDIGAD